MRAMLTLVLLASTFVASAQEAPQRNPFQAPVDLQAPNADNGGGQPVVLPDQLRLRATLISGDNSSVILEGAILSIGEEYSGYRLISVREGEAVLRKNGESIRLSMDERDE